jgi:PadR family transcriptional regulator PadR
VSVAWPFRVTDPLLEVLDVLVEADASLHGWAIMRETQRSGPTVYQVLERLRKAKWVECWWEDADAARDRSPERENVPRRRYYRLSAEGAAGAPVLLAERGYHRARLQQAENIPGLATFGRQLRLLFGGTRP